MKKVKSAIGLNGKVYNEAELKTLLVTNDAALRKAILRIFQYQTLEEKTVEATVYHNNVGFTGADANLMSSFAKQIERKDWLSPKQLAIARKKMPKYAGQLLRIMASAQ